MSLPTRFLLLLTVLVATLSVSTVHAVEGPNPPGPTPGPGQSYVPSFSYSFDGPYAASAAPAPAQDIHVQLNMLSVPASSGVQGWSIGVSSGPGCGIASATWVGTAMDDAANGGFLQSDGFRSVQVTVTGDGATAACVPSLSTNVVLPPQGAPYRLLTFTTEQRIVSPATNCSDCYLTFGTVQPPVGQPVSNSVTYKGNSYDPSLDTLSYQICSPEKGSQQSKGSAFVRGDADGDGAMELNDGLAILNFLYQKKRSRGLRCLDAADADNNGAVEMNDAIRILNFKFLGGPSPVGFRRNSCGGDSGRGLGCQGYNSCPVSRPSTKKAVRAKDHTITDTAKPVARPVTNPVVQQVQLPRTGLVAR